MRLFFLIFLSFGLHQLHAQEFLLTPELSQAWQEISRLRISNAEELIKEERHSRPHNLLTDVVDLQLIFQKALVSGAAEDEKIFQQAKSALQQKLLSVKTDDPWQK